jgi:hypothetical protein
VINPEILFSPQAQILGPTNLSPTCAEFKIKLDNFKYNGNRDLKIINWALANE